MQISIIVAVSENGIIGRDGALPWRISNDLKYFKSVTIGKPVVMGRKTYESIDGPLPGRSNLVVTRRPTNPCKELEFFENLNAAIEAAKIRKFDEVMIIGGGSLYAEALEITDRIYMTEVHAIVTGDVSFAPLNQEQWTEISRETHKASVKDDHDHSFVILDRVKSV